MIKLPGLQSTRITSRTSFIYRIKPLKSSGVEGFKLFKYFEAIKFKISWEEGMAPLPKFPLGKAVVSHVWGWLGPTGATRPSLITPWDSCGCPIINVAPCCTPGPEMASQSIFNLRRTNEKNKSVKGGFALSKIWLYCNPSTCMSLHKKIQVLLALKCSDLFCNLNNIQNTFSLI